MVYSYVVEGPGGRLTDLLSFYTLPSSVIGNDQYSSLKVGGSQGGWVGRLGLACSAARGRVGTFAERGSRR